MIINYTLFYTLHFKDKLKPIYFYVVEKLI